MLKNTGRDAKQVEEVKQEEDREDEVTEEKKKSLPRYQMNKSKKGPNAIKKGTKSQHGDTNNEEEIQFLTEPKTEMTLRKRKW